MDKRNSIAEEITDAIGNKTNSSSVSIKVNLKPSYQPQASGVNIEAEIYQFARLRQLSLLQRLEIVIAHERGVKKLCLAGIKLRHPGATLEKIRYQFTRAVLGQKYREDFHPTGNNEQMWIQDSITLAGELHQIFELINIAYYVSGGVAASLHGEPRSTRDLDLVIEIELEAINLLVTTLEQARYYCPASAVEGLKQGREKVLNITHTETIANADIYISDVSAFSKSQMERRHLIDTEGMPKFWIASAEDTILQKLRWGKASQSEKQWRDVLGILKLQAESLDYGYLAQWAEILDLIDDFSQALTQAGL